MGVATAPTLFRSAASAVEDGKGRFRMTEEQEQREPDETAIDDVGDGEALPERIAMSLITPTGDDPVIDLEPLRGPEEP